MYIVVLNILYFMKVVKLYYVVYAHAIYVLITDKS